MDLTVRIRNVRTVNGKISTAGAVKKSSFLFGNDYFGYLFSVKLIAFTSYSVLSVLPVSRIKFPPEEFFQKNRKKVLHFRFGRAIIKRIVKYNYDYM